jgi:hypothetical protein
VVLDEHIGIEGIPARFEEQQNVGAEITKAYIARDFRVFGRAFTRYKSTTLSFRSFMNFEFLDSEGTPQARTGRENALFAELAERGYDISVLQTTFLDLCHSASSSHRISQCRTYPFSPHLDSLRDSSLPISRKAMVIVNNVFIRMGVTDLVDRVAMSTPGVRLGLPRWPVGTCLNCIASKTALEEFERGIDGTARGRAFFVHLMWPHEPYQVYDQNCEPEMTPSLRRGSFDDRYAEYLEQVKCSQTALIGLLERLLRKDGFQDATIVVHGDHGGRLFESPAVGSRSMTRESVQAYSTFFAVRSPESEPGYDGRPYPVDDLLADVMGVEPAPGREEYRYTVANSDGLETIPPFARGVLSEDW